MTEQQVQALQQVLANQHAAIWAYGEIGATVSQEYLKPITSRDNAQRAMRTKIEDLLRALNGEPVPAQAGYRVPGLLSDDESALAFAADVEESLTQQWRFCIGTDGEPDATFRQLCLDGMLDTASAAGRWRRELDPEALPPSLPGMA
ncbi:ferritin-like domain-containing protein [Cumulibacter soli]|uniref:ferritin-like domain-containing protein n=1 Tax=Cumulibacter soli TaxID=2546344 RepID=UPI0010674287|nr:ferritin-like domain-containing protein [Cumulibacter soli]